MSETLSLGNGNWATKEGSVLAYNSENNNFKPLPFDFTRASTATYVDSDGLIKTAGNGEPRIDYTDNTDGALLLEPARTNLVTYSEDFSQWNVYYGIGGSMNIQSNYGVSPSGKQDSTKITFPLPSTSLYLSIPTNGTYTSTVYVKGVSGQTIRLGLGQDSVGEGELFTLNGEWQRFENTNTDTGTGYPTINTFGASALELEVWGFQVEQGSYATSYIPTSGSAVTRLAESCTQTIPDTLVGSTEGTLFIDMNSWQSGSWGSSSVSFGLYVDGGQTNAVGFTSNQVANNLRARMADDTGSDYIGTNFTPSSRDKLAIKWDGTNVSFFKNGSLFASVANTGGKSYNTVSLPISARTGLFPINDFRIYDTALTDSELITLTS